MNSSNVSMITEATENTYPRIEETPPELSPEGREMLQALASYDLDLIEVEFDGDGDNGQVTDIRLLRNGVELPDDPIIRPEHRDFVDDYLSDDPWANKEPRTFRLLVELLAWHVLARGFPGWEINDGGYGEILIHPKDSRISLDMNIREVENFALEFSLDLEENANG